VGSSSDWLSRFDNALGRPDAVEVLTATTWRVALDGRRLVAKVGPGVADEADGLRQLASVPGAPPVPEVVLLTADLLVTTWIEQGQRRGAAEEGLGEALANLHAAPWKRWGSGSAWIGDCPVDASESPTAAAFYGERLSDLARRCDLRGAIEPVVARLDVLLPPGDPCLVHGDLWWGNVLWGVDGRAWLIDPSVHGGHAEEDLAMLALFGALPTRLVDAYGERNPLADGWEERVELFQLYPLLVHTVLFGGGYRSRAAAIARRFA
jgi:fructosamine-3-kinase